MAKAIKRQRNIQAYDIEIVSKLKSGKNGGLQERFGKPMTPLLLTTQAMCTLYLLTETKQEHAHLSCMLVVGI